MRAVLEACVNAFIYSRTPHLLLGDVSTGSSAPVPAAALLLAAGQVLKPALTVIGRLSGPIRKEQLLRLTPLLHLPQQNFSVRDWNSKEAPFRVLDPSEL